MKKNILLLVLLFLFTGIVLAADPVEGYWISYDEKTKKATAGWHIFQSNGKLFGKILSVAGKPQDGKCVKCKPSYDGFPYTGNVNEKPTVGTNWIFNLKMDKTGAWSGGHIIDPGSGKMYKCKINYHAENGGTLEMRGEIGLGIGRSQFWKKATLEQASGLR